MSAKKRNVKKDPELQMAKSDRARCQRCLQPIQPKGVIRLAFPAMCNGMLVDRYLHLRCFAQNNIRVDYAPTSHANCIKGCGYIRKGELRVVMFLTKVAEENSEVGRFMKIYELECAGPFVRHLLTEVHMSAADLLGMQQLTPADQARACNVLSSPSVTQVGGCTTAKMPVDVDVVRSPPPKRKPARKPEALQIATVRQSRASELYSSSDSEDELPLEKHARFNKKTAKMEPITGDSSSSDDSSSDSEDELPLGKHARFNKKTAKKEPITSDSSSSDDSSSDSEDELPLGVYTNKKARVHVEEEKTKKGKTQKRPQEDPKAKKKPKVQGAHGQQQQQQGARGQQQQQGARGQHKLKKEQSVQEQSVKTTTHSSDKLWCNDGKGTRHKAADKHTSRPNKQAAGAASTSSMLKTIMAISHTDEGISSQEKRPRKGEIKHQHEAAVATEETKSRQKTGKHGAKLISKDPLGLHGRRLAIMWPQSAKGRIRRREGILYYRPYEGTDWYAFRYQHHQVRTRGISKETLTNRKFFVLD